MVSYMFPHNAPTPNTDNSIEKQGMFNGIANAVKVGVSSVAKTVANEISSGINKGLGGGLLAQTTSKVAKTIGDVITVESKKRKKKVEDNNVELETKKTPLSKAIDGLKSATLSVGTKVEGLGTTITEGLGGEVTDSITEGLGGGTLAKSINSMLNYMKDNFIPFIKAALKSPFTLIASLFKGFNNLVTKYGKGIWGLLRDSFFAMGILLKTISIGIGSLAGNLVKGIGKSFGKFGEWIFGLLPVIGGFLLSGFKNIFSLGGGLFKLLGGPLLSLFTPVTSLLTKGLTTAFTGVTSVIGKLFTSMLPLLKGGLIGLLAGVAGYGLGTGAAYLVDYFQNKDKKLPSIKKLSEINLSDQQRQYLNNKGYNLNDMSISELSAEDRSNLMNISKLNKLSNLSASSLQSLDLVKYNKQELSNLSSTKKDLASTTIINNVSPVSTNVNNTNSQISIPASFNTFNNENSFNVFNKSFAY